MMKMKTEISPQLKPFVVEIVESGQLDVGLAAELLRQGKLLGIPTETVYGLGADATNGNACAKIFEAKGRPSFNPLIAHCATIEMAMQHGHLTPLARKLADAFWPGPLTLIVRKRRESPIADLVTAGLETIAIRIPDAGIMKDLIVGLDAPIAAPSANRSGHVSATTAQAVADDLGNSVSLIIDAGPSPLGLESTIIDVSGDRAVLLRPGGIARGDVEAVLGEPLQSALDPDTGHDQTGTVPAQEQPKAPGMLLSHYAPSCAVRLNVDQIHCGEAFLAFGDHCPDGRDEAVQTINLSPAGNLREAAAKLFSALRILDAAGVSAIAVSPIPADGLGEAINDRLRRAAVGRDQPS